MLVLLGILLSALGVSQALTIRQNYKQKLQIDGLKRQLIDMICETEEGRLLLSGGHDWKHINDAAYMFENTKSKTDTLRTQECVNCGLIKRYWVGGLGCVLDDKSRPMHGLFRTGHRLEEEDEQMVSCKNGNNLMLLLKS